MITIIPKGVVETTKDKNYQRVEIIGLSTDSKPTQVGENYVGNGSTYIEMDGGLFFYDLENTKWVEFGVETEPETNNSEENNEETPTEETQENE